MTSRLDRRTAPSVAVGLVALLAFGGCSRPNEAPAIDPVAPGPATPDVADSVQVEDPPTLRVLISDEERSRLVAQATSDLQTARSIASDRPESATLSAEDRQRWESLDHYIELAESFLEDGDVRAASDLALKARLLAADLDRD